MAEICSSLAADITRACGANAPTMGMEQHLLLFPSASIGPSTFTFDNTNSSSLITNFAPTVAGIEIEGIFDQDNILLLEESVNPQDEEPGVPHVIEGIKILNSTAAIQHEVNKLVFGGDLYVAVLRRRWRGAAGVNQFLIAGVHRGLKATYVRNSNENDGVAVLRLATPEGKKEPFAPYQLLMTDAATTLAAYVAKFAP